MGAAPRSTVPSGVSQEASHKPVFPLSSAILAVPLSQKGTSFMTPRSLLPLPICAALVSLTTPTALAASTDGADWPQWRGPDRTGISAESMWSAEGKATPLWTKDLGLGHSSFAVADGRVYTLGYDAEEKLDSVYCFNAETGEEVWRHRYGAEIWDVAHDGGALTTPTVVDGLVYTSNREAKVFCFEGDSGEIIWSRDLREDLELEPPTWGFSASPLAVNGLIVLNMDRVIALDPSTGEQVWISEKGYGKAYSTPTPFALEETDYLAVLSGSGLALLLTEDGTETDFFGWSKDPEIYPMSPVVIDDRLFISAGYDRGCAMLRVKDGKLTELWSSRVMRNKMSGAVLFKDHLFGFDESILKCIDLDGNERWRVRGMGTGSMTIAGERLVILDGRGHIIVGEADPEKYTELSRQSVFEDGTSWSTPILSHGRVYCRTSLGAMACLDYRGTGTVAQGTQDTAKEIPSAESIVARHIATVKGQQALDQVRSLTMSGTSQSLINTVRSGAINLSWDAKEGFSWKDETGFDFGFNTDCAWRMTPRSAPTVLKDEDQKVMHRAGDLQRLFDPSLGFSSMETVDATVIEGRDCYSVRATTPDGAERTLYFEIDSGLFAGHEGEGLSLWTLSEYQDFGGVMLPTHWSIFEPVKGERASAVFETASINPSPDVARFATPDKIKPFLRTPEEIERDNVRLKQLHAAMIGEWRSEDGEDDRVMGFQVDEGFFLFVRPERDPTYLSEPDEEGRVCMLEATYVTFTPEKNEQGIVEAIVIRVGEDVRDRLIRVES